VTSKQTYIMSMYIRLLVNRFRKKNLLSEKHKYIQTIMSQTSGHIDD